ncbi:LytTR family DNA-binding domain-containing protein [uncultured Parabacteroides sp.]|uniref:LytTR family DNA-binding domain-containing protein n=1 Tax=uncultured Parabacteroides sp. TaxID=512312 RepID=UPI00262F5DE3|nr:LytTR family DNA-binding domain-containing protein [uncultured Parabacteroides sp.]
MQEHPITTSILHKGLGSLLLLLAIAIQCALLTIYGDLPPSVTLADSLLSVALFAIAGYYLWYVQCTLHIIQARAALAILVQIAYIAGCSIILQIFKLEDWEEFSVTIPFRFLFGLMAWIILSQWYASQEKKEDTSSPGRQTEIEEERVPAVSQDAETLDRISVKDGARIHIIPIKEIFYLQACGDYVTLFTTTGQHVKEQTMKYFERNLPSPEFVRIHRSYIVNTEQILRVELFGKETYQVRLKDGTYLRASSAGYKLLKERLSL